MAQMKQHAAEQLSFEQALERLPATFNHARTVLGRLDRIHPISPSTLIVDLGAAQGRFLIACSKQGLWAIGIEPYIGAREVASHLAKHQDTTITMLAGVAEDLPLKDESCNLVHANSLIEHVTDAKEVFQEAWRILKPGGILWFSTASSMCPKQGEIDGFPFFGWYPNRLKQRIMQYAKIRKPHLIGYTDTPAINWFTPWKARRLLLQAGFSGVYDRWDLRLPSEGGPVYQKVLSLAKLSKLMKIVFDVLIPDCAYAAIK